jgi:CMP-N-acetylneuraminic acid synthetase
LSVEEIDQVVINTDARHILRESGLTDSDRVLIRDRKPELCGDSVSMNKVLADDIANVEADLYLMTHTTNPLMSGDTIRGSIQALQENGKADSLFTVDKIQTRFYRADGSAVNHDPDNLIRTQELEPWYEENSNLYIFTRDSFAKTNARIGKRPMMYEGPRIESIDIDDQQDWDFAVIAARYLLEQQGATK